METAKHNTDSLNWNRKLLRDSNDATCYVVPALDSDERYLKIRMTWPKVHVNNPDFLINIKGKELICDSDMHETLVYMQVVFQPRTTFRGRKRECTYFTQTLEGSFVTCVFQCSPSPDYAEAVIVYVQGALSTNLQRELCEVTFV